MSGILAASDPSLAQVLVVDDHPGMAESLAEMIERAGFRASWACGGAEGVDAFHAARAAGSPFSAVITDVRMPGLDGLGLAAVVKGVSPSTPVVLLTAYLIATGDDQLPRHVDAVLPKPPSDEELRSTLGRVIAHTAAAAQDERSRWSGGETTDPAVR